MDIIPGFLKRTGYMFYILNPKEHVFEKTEQVPDYFKEVTPSFIFIITLEICIRYLRGKPLLRINDTVTNVCQGMLVEIFKIPFLGAELVVYVWIYNNWRLVALPSDSVFTWLIAMIVADFCFYWLHRTNHQISFLWNFHEVHHSSEEYNMTVPLRIHILSSASMWYAYLPMAFAVPPQVFLVHYQLVVIFQFWLHSELIPPLGFLEWFLNTPGFHRVHHGRNRRCIDKNFGSVFIIWDRIFGTFEPATDENIHYGLTTPIKTFNSFWLQTNHFWAMCKKFIAMKGFRNKLWSLITGPGWSVGKPWLGSLEDIPEPSSNEKKYDPQIPFLMKMYAVIHCGAVVVGYLQMIFKVAELPTVIVTCCSLFIIISAIAFGAIFDGRAWVSLLEISRCMLYFCVELVVSSQLQELPFITEMSFKVFKILFIGSLLFWLSRIPDVARKIAVRCKLHSH